MKNKLFDFKNKRRVFRVVLAHITALLSVMTITFFIIDRFNDAMEFMTSDLSKVLFLVLAVLSLISSIVTIVCLWVNPDRIKKRKNISQPGDKRNRV
ncbi:MAG: hypothetical protein K6F68_03595 [Clostridiales bacterium]|nr:hypothetical protein [Clostridiales bacterium]